MRLFSNGLPVKDGLHRLAAFNCNRYGYKFNTGLFKDKAGFSRIHNTKFRPDNGRYFKKILSTSVNKRSNLMRVSCLK